MCVLAGVVTIRPTNGHSYCFLVLQDTMTTGIFGKWCQVENPKPKQSDGCIDGVLLEDGGVSVFPLINKLLWK